MIPPREPQTDNPDPYLPDPGGDFERLLWCAERILHVATVLAVGYLLCRAILPFCFAVMGWR
jgi:hypothetical protein